MDRPLLVVRLPPLLWSDAVGVGGEVIRYPGFKYYGVGDQQLTIRATLSFTYRLSHGLFVGVAAALILIHYRSQTAILRNISTKALGH